MTLYFCEIDGCTPYVPHSLTSPAPLPPGWEIATGTSDDIRVIGAHRWQARYLLCRGADPCSSTQAYGTSMCEKGPMHNIRSGSTSLPSIEIGVTSLGRVVKGHVDGYEKDVLLRRRA
jgi:hypothetical protein